MAAFGTRNMVYTSQENGMLKGKSLCGTQTLPKRDVLKEVSNKVLPQVKGKQNVNENNKVEKKTSLQPLKCLNSKPLVNQKPPSIQVKETKACRLRKQHSRQSIGKVDSKSNKEQLPKHEEVAKLPLTVKLVHQQHGDNVQNVSQASKSVKPKESKSTTHLDKNNIEKKPCELQETNVGDEVSSTFSSTLLNCAYIIDIDKDDENDPIMLGMYAKDMYKYLREMEVKFPITPQYLKNSRLNGKMRATLIDWLVDVQREFDMNPETLFLTVAIIDRFLQENTSTNRNKLQLVGITAMFVASKYEEMILPDVNELVYVSDNAYSKREILQMEITMVKALDCSFGRPLPIHFLRRYSKADMVAPLIHVMAKYIMEMGTLEYDLCHVAPSLLAAAALYISLWLLKRRKDVWSNSLRQYSSYTVEEVVPIVKKLCPVLIDAETLKFQAIRKKYSHPKNMQVSLLPMLKQLPELVKNI